MYSNVSRISLIVPVYNCEGTIVRCLTSIVNQDWADVETIIVDDGSSDDSLRICRDYAKKHCGIVVLPLNHFGPSKSRNAGLQAATGMYVAFCDADDELLPSALSSMMDQVCDSIDLVVGNVHKRGSPLIKRGVRLSQKEALRRFFRHDDRRLLGSVYGKLFKRLIIDPPGGTALNFDENVFLGEDALFLLRYLQRCRAIWLYADFVYSHRPNADGIISSKRLSDYLSALDASKKMIEAVADDHGCLNLALKDLYWVYKLILRRFPETSDAELVKNRLISILGSLQVDLGSFDLLFPAREWPGHLKEREHG